MNIMKDAIIEIVIGLIITFFLLPYFSLLYIKDIANELSDIKKELEKMNERFCKRN